jgi:hypothetical protein
MQLGMMDVSGEVGTDRAQRLAKIAIAFALAASLVWGLYFGRFFLEVLASFA